MERHAGHCCRDYDQISVVSVQEIIGKHTVIPMSLEVLTDLNRSAPRQGFESQVPGNALFGMWRVDSGGRFGDGSNHCEKEPCPLAKARCAATTAVAKGGGAAQSDWARMDSY
jgi:hypothetical protein